MKILIINTVPTANNGITNVIYNYLQVIDPSYANFDYVSINQLDQKYIDVIKSKGGICYIIPRTSKTLFSYVANLRSIVSQNKYDAVHIHANSHTSILELMSVFLGNCRVRIIHAHSTNCSNLRIHSLLSPVFNYLCTHRLACGEQAGRFMFGNHSFDVLNNGIDVKKFAFNNRTRILYREKLNVGNDEILIGHVGYFLALKNQRFIVQILSSLLKNRGKYKLVLLGDGELKTEVEKLVVELNLQNNVFFTGNVDNVHEFLNAFDLIIMPSLFEGLPLTLIEQQANGLQCICSNCITKEVDKTGNIKFLSLDLSPEDWAHEVNNFIDLDSRELRSKKAVNDIANSGYSIQEEANRLLNYYNDCISFSKS